MTLSSCSDVTATRCTGSIFTYFSFLLVILSEEHTIYTQYSVQHEACKQICMYPLEEMLFIAGSTSVVRSVLIASVSIHNLAAVMSGTAIFFF